MERLLGTNLYVASAAILIVTGSIVAIISFLGTFGAYKEIKCMLLTYFVILFMLFIVMVTAGILGYVFRLEVKYPWIFILFQLYQHFILTLSYNLIHHANYFVVDLHCSLLMAGGRWNATRDVFKYGSLRKRFSGDRSLGCGSNAREYRNHHPIDICTMSTLTLLFYSSLVFITHGHYI